MPLLERLALAAWLCSAATQLMAQSKEPSLGYLHRAPIQVQRSAGFVELVLPASVHARSQQAGLGDLRVVDARGERVPFALLAPRTSESQAVEHRRDTKLYALPPRPTAGQSWSSPIELVVQGERISVKRAGASPAAGPGRSAGWLIDLGERAKDQPLPGSLQLAWTGPAEFSVGYAIEVSDDLRSWRPAGGGQLMALAAPTPTLGALTQPVVSLAGAAGRFVRLLWIEVESAPQISAAVAISSENRWQEVDAPTEIVVAPSAEPLGKGPLDGSSTAALHFDLGGSLPLHQVDLRLGAGEPRIAPVRLMGRNQIDEPWRELAQTVIYRLDRGGRELMSPPLALHASVRYLRLRVDERAPPLPSSTLLVVQARLPRLVFANQGQPPLSLLVGSADARSGALPVSTLVPGLDDERQRFGSAVLGAWSEVADVARQRQDAHRRAQWRPWLLWAVLIAGVSGLGLMVWRLVKGRGTAS